MIRASKPPLVLIAGPTASGKSALALELAKESRGVVVNADSAQLYRDIPVLSAAPSEADCQIADHRLYGVCDGADPMSAARWAKFARAEVADVHKTGRLPIVVGGTGLYLRTLLEGIAPIPPIDPLIRSEVRAADVAANLARLGQLDREAASRLGPRDMARIARALEVVLSSGRPLSHWQARREGGIANEVELRPLLLLPPRDWLYRRCNERFAAMVENGGIEEVRRLIERGLSPALPVMRAIGVSEIAGYIRGDTTLDEARSAGQQATRNYAKRQYTWFSRQPPKDWRRTADTLPAVRAELVEALSLPLRGEE